MKKVLSEEQEKFLCMQRIGGKKIRELAEEWGIGLGTVHSILHRRGVRIPEQNSPIKRKRGRRQNAEEKPKRRSEGSNKE